MISREDIQNLAQLSRLTLSEAEMASLEKEFSAILDYVGQVSAVAPASDELVVGKLHNIMREDVPRAEADTMTGKEKSIIAQFPRKDGEYLEVRKIIEKNG